jgi:hypothetical protein
MTTRSCTHLDVLADFRKLFRDLATSQGNTFKARVHCECALIGYLRSLPPSQPPPLDYLGMSKLSCRACAIYIKAWNTTKAGDRHAHFHTRGTHQKWHYPWGFPASDDNVEETFRGFIGAEIAESLIAQGRVRLRRPSTAARHLVTAATTTATRYAMFMSRPIRGCVE